MAARRESATGQSRRIAYDRCAGRNIFNHYASRAHNRIVADNDAWNYNCAAADPDILADDYVLS